MANAKKCDRCGRLYEFYEGIAFGKGEYKYSWLRLFTTHGSVYKTYDLCPTCMTQMVAFLNNHKDLNVDDEPRSCKTCKYDGMNLDVCMGCTDDNYQMWKEKDNGADRETT